MHAATMGTAAPQQAKKRYGTIAAKIGSSHQHRLGIDTTHALAGTIVHLQVQDITRHPTEAEHARWHCRHPACQAQHGKGWTSKAQLLAAHPESRLLTKQEETHLYLAVVEIAAVDGQPEDATAKRKERKPQPAIVMLLSDEE